MIILEQLNNYNKIYVHQENQKFLFPEQSLKVKMIMQVSNYFEVSMRLLR